MSKSEGTKVERLRFRDENGEEFPDWETKKLGELIDDGTVSIGRGKVISKIDIANNPGEYPIYSSSATNNGTLGSYGAYMFDDERISWSIDGGGKFFYRPEHKYSITNVSGWIKVLDERQINTHFLYSSLLAQWQHKHFDYSFKAHPSVIKNEYIIPLPSLPEQKKIAAFLDKVETRARVQKDLVKLLEDEYKGYLQRIFSRELRFRDENGREFPDWETKRLGDILVPIKYQRVSNPETHRLLTVKLHANGIVPTGNFPTPTENGRPYYQRKIGEFLIGRQNFHNGGFGIVRQNADGYIASNAISGYSTTQSIQYIDFFFQASYRKYDKFLEGTGQKEIPQRVFDTLSLPLPSLPEQKKIAAFLDALQARIAVEKDLLKLYEDEYKGYLQRML